MLPQLALMITSNCASKKVPHGLIVKEKKVPSRTRTKRKLGEDGEEGGEEDDDAADHTSMTKRWLRAFEDISGYSGVSMFLV